MILNRASCTIGIVTGALVPDKMPLGENDGPLGSVIMAKALKKLGYKIVFSRILPPRNQLISYSLG